MRILLCLLLMMTLTGCLNNISMSGLASTGGATAGATLGGLISPTAAVVGGIAGGVATDAVIPEVVQSAEDYAGQDGELSFTELLAFMWANFTSHIVTFGIVAFVLWFLTGYIGLRMKRPEEKKAEEQAKTLLDKLMEK